MKILIDADGCPVVDIALALAREYHVSCMILCDTSHVFEKEGATVITVSKGPDSVDFALVNRIAPGDLVITQDYGLAAMCLAKKAIPVSQNGMVYNGQNIDALLEERYFSKKLRMSGKRPHGQPKRTREQDDRFEKVFRTLVTKGLG